jgi:hypothetical protein
MRLAMMAAGHGESDMNIRHAMAAATILLALPGGPAMAQPTGAAGDADNGLALICWGEGRKPATSYSSGYAWDNDKHKFVPQGYIQNTTKEFDAEVQVELHDN